MFRTVRAYLEAGGDPKMASVAKWMAKLGLQPEDITKKAKPSVETPSDTMEDRLRRTGLIG